MNKADKIPQRISPPNSQHVVTTLTITGINFPNFIKIYPYYTAPKENNTLNTLNSLCI